MAILLGRTLRMGPSLFLLCWTAVGCDLASGLTDIGGALGNQDKALIDSPGRRVAAGKFRSLLVDGSLKDGGHVIALEETDEGERLAIIPYVDGSACYVDPAVNVERLSSRVDVELPGVLSVQRDSDESRRGEINFFAFNCKEVIEPIDNSSLPQVAFPDVSPEGLLALSASGDLYFVKPEERERILVASGVSQARTHGDTLWAVEDGRLVIRDRDLEIIAETGSAVREFAITGGSTVHAAYVDEEGLFAFNEEDGATLVATTGCTPIAWGADTVAYLDPCDERRLRVIIPGDRLGKTEETVTLIGPRNVILHDRAQAFFGSQVTEILLLQGEPGADRGSLVVSTLAEDAEPEEGVLRLDTLVLEESDATLRWGVALTHFDGVSGTLVQVVREDNDITGLRPLAERVAQLPGGTASSGRGILTDFDGQTGTLNLLLTNAEETSTFTLAEKVPVQTQVAELDTGRVLFIGDSDDGATGSLYLTAGAQASASALTLPRKIAEDVYVDTARFLEQPHGVAYLARRSGSDHPTLEVWLLESELTVEVSDAVSEYRTVPWPAPGILYAVPEGPNVGLWFAKAR